MNGLEIEAQEPSEKAPIAFFFDCGWNIDAFLPRLLDTAKSFFFFPLFFFFSLCQAANIESHRRPSLFFFFFFFSFYFFCSFFFFSLLFFFPCSSVAMASPEKNPIATEAMHAAPPGPPTPAFSPDTSALAAAIDPEIEASASDASRAAAKRPRSPSPSRITAATDASNGELSPKKLARLASGSRFSDSATELVANPTQDDDSQHRIGGPDESQEGAALLQRFEGADDYVAQTALSVLRGAEALMSQKAASEANTEVVAEAAAAVAAAASGETMAADDTAAHLSAEAAAAAGAAAALAEAAAEGLAAGEGGVGLGHGSEHLAPHERRHDAMYPANVVSAPPGAPEDQLIHGLPMAIPELMPKSPSSKKHKCPYCDTEFTRHHNLKSHLLTHSQEKPYVCQGCDMRFRRLHDLKRHSKLHTGEKPHICPRCDRKFARGDALARHSKGAGGCAGRRTSSSGNFSAIADDSFDASSMADADNSVMTGIEYDNADDEERKRLSLSVNRTPHNRGPRSSTEAFAAHTRTYPLISADGQRAPTAASGLYPPNVDRTSTGGSSTPGMTNSAVSGTTGNGHTPNTSLTMPINASNASLFSQHGMAESPKALSPAVGSSDSGMQAQFAQRRSHMTEPRVLALADSAQQIRNGGSTNGDTNANIFSSEQGMWTYIQTLENKLKTQDEKLKQQDERIALLEAAKLGYEAQISSLTKGILYTQPASSVTPGPSGDAGLEANADEEPQPAEPRSDQEVEQQVEQQLGQQVGQHVEQQMSEQQQAERHAEQQLEQHIGQQLEEAVAQR